jgi:hypothetical protein
MNSGTDHARPRPDSARRQLICAFAVVTLAIATLGLRVLQRPATKNNSSDRGNDLEREHFPDELDEVSSRTLYEVVDYDRRLNCFWLLGLPPEVASIVAATLLADETHRSDCDD